MLAADALRLGAVCGWAEIVSEILKFNCFAENGTSVLLKLALATCTKHTTQEKRVLHATYDLLAPAHFSAERAVGARRLSAVRRWAKRVPEKLKFGLFSET